MATKPTAHLKRALAHALDSGISLDALAQEVADNPPTIGAEHPVSLLAYRIREATQKANQQADICQTKASQIECQTCSREQWLDLDDGTVTGCPTCDRRGWITSEEQAATDPDQTAWEQYLDISI